MRHHKFFSFIIFLCLALFIAESAQAARSSKRKKRVSKQAPASLRLVSLKPNLSEMLVALDQAKNIVGKTKYCRSLPEAIPVVADYNTVNVEAVLRLKPDLVLSSTENSQGRQYQSLQQAGISVLFLSAQSYDEMVSSFLQLGQRLGVQNRAQKQIDDLQKRLGQVRDRVYHKRSGGASAVFLIQRQPLMVASGQTFLSTLFARVGFFNVFANNAIAYPLLDQEALVRESADHVLDFSHGAKDKPLNFLNKSVTPVLLDGFLASPRVVVALELLLSQLGYESHVSTY